MADNAIVDKTKKESEGTKSLEKEEGGKSEPHKSLH